ncbi:prokaryotic molybdopterin-containing oxidoreductase family, membrane subunit [Draconibacterium orientale]|uniref:Prokaryotic molybdopterin-containing oxidoreductase family, membrane subunit n=2 Tax=Draconibacterium orientale TaxID=1168034 RepID=A0A1I0CCJ8_9BACT|nr:NrfD/PsrC family molybdoenzyme membrane anchor subunit [Draconibacterium orientale]SET16999.1 prokaryotic molybdopterin-containing oxidoreductase family, membrane subunit [Draconibacterium orientale]
MMEKTKSPEESRKLLDKITFDLTRSIVKRDELTHFWYFILVMFAAVGLWGWGIQIRDGLGVTGMRDYVSWGMYIANFVFFVAVSLIGFLISSSLQLLKISWSKPISRVAEQIAIAAVALAGIIIVMDMGRPDRFLNVFLHGRFASPIIWDVTVVTTYLTISVLLYYIPLIPDLALLRDRGGDDIPKWKMQVYKILSLGWKGNDKQYKLVAHSMRVLMILILPVGLSIHTVTSWLFAATLRSGWDTTIFGPYFVAGAFVAGAAAVVILMYAYRVRYRLGDYFEELHFDYMGKLLVFVCLVYLYFNINEFWVPAYKMKTAEGIHLRTLFTGSYAPMFWSAQMLGLILPILLMLFPFFRKPLPLTIISVFVLIASWLKRYIIVVPTLEHPFLPVQNVPDYFKHYSPTSIEIMITIFSFMAALLIITVLAKMFPVITIWEYAEEKGIDKEILAEPKK